MPNSIGDPCSLYLDLPYEHPDSPREGDWVATHAGARYLISRVHAVMPRVEQHHHKRYQLRCVRLERDAPIPPEVTVFWLTWYSRNRSH